VTEASRYRSGERPGLWRATKTATPSGISWSPLCSSGSRSTSRGSWTAIDPGGKRRRRLVLRVGWPGKGLDHLAPVERLAKPGRCGDARRRTAHTFRGPGQCARESCGGAPSSWGEWRQTPRPSFVDEPAPVLAPARDGRRYLATHRVRSAHPGSDRRSRARVEVLGVECRYSAWPPGTATHSLV
jgi:hypothetical protein